MDDDDPPIDDELPFTWNDLPQIIDRMHTIARARKNRIKGLSLATGDLLDEAVEELLRDNPGDWDSVSYFLGSFNLATRRKVADWCRARAGKNVAVAVGGDIEAFAKEYTNSSADTAHKALAKLTVDFPLWARIFQAYVLHGDDVEEIGARENLPEREVYRVLTKAKAALRVIIAKLEGQNPPAQGATAKRVRTRR